MSRSKRTQKQIQQDKRTKRFEHVGDPEVAEKLQEIEFSGLCLGKWYRTRQLGSKHLAASPLLLKCSDNL